MKKFGSKIFVLFLCIGIFSFCFFSFQSLKAIENNTLQFFDDSFSYKNSSELTAHRLPQKDFLSVSPIVSAPSAIAIDRESGKILYEKNAFDRRSIASLTKVMTVIITLESNDNLEKVVTIPPEVESIEPSKMNLVPNDTLTLRNLVYGSLIASANDAAYVLGKQDPDIIEKMNQKAVEIGLYDTHFSNTVGWDEEENFSSAYDIAKLMNYALKNPIIEDAITHENFTVISEKQRVYNLQNTNKLFDSFLHEIGGKTGTTDAAGQCLINVVQIQEGHEIITVVLSSSDRFKDTKILSYWIDKSFSW